MSVGERFLPRLLWNWGAPAFQALVSFAMVPIITALLGPVDIGIFALASSLASLVAAVAGIGSTYIISAHYPQLQPNDQTRLVSTVIFVGAALSLLASGALLSLWSLLTLEWSEFENVSAGTFALLLASSALSVPWTVATDVLMVRSEARNFALVGMLQTAVGAAVTIMGLYILDLGILSLFVAVFAGSIICAGAAIVLLRRQITLKLETRWLIECLRVGPIMSGAHLLEVLHNAIERGLLSSVAGWATLGLYAHSQQYRNMGQTVVKGVARAVWPISLAECRSLDRRFDRTNSAWRAMSLIVTGAGIFFALFGTDVVSLLTHDKFTSAGPYVALWMAFVLVQNVGKPQLAMMFVSQSGVALGSIGIVVRLLAIGLLFVFVPAIGVFGAFAAAFLQQIGLRIAFYFRSSRLGKAPFQDGWMIAGCVGIGMAMVFSDTLDPSRTERLAVFATMFAVMSLWGRACLRDIILIARGNRRAG